MEMNFLQIVQLLLSGGIMSGGVGVLKWAMSVEKRLQRLEDDNPGDTRLHRKAPR